MQDKPEIYSLCIYSFCLCLLIDTGIRVSIIVVINYIVPGIIVTTTEINL